MKDVISYHINRYYSFNIWLTGALPAEETEIATEEKTP